ncbi:GNAT family N-acetyltransferase [Myroides sp. LJL119]
MFLQAQSIFLRALEPEDLEFIYQIENNINLWEFSNTQSPYSRFLIKQYLQNAHMDIYEAKQLRLVICDKTTSKTIGLIDLFDFDPTNNRAGVGIIIQHDSQRGLGIGRQALKLVMDYAKEHLYLHQLYANITTDNQPSIGLFTKAGFELVGVKKQWTRVGDTYKDEAIYQLIF